LVLNYFLELKSSKRKYLEIKPNSLKDNNHNFIFFFLMSSQDLEYLKKRHDNNILSYKELEDIIKSSLSIPINYVGADSLIYIEDYSHIVRLQKLGFSRERAKRHILENKHLFKQESNANYKDSTSFLYYNFSNKMQVGNSFEMNFSLRYNLSELSTLGDDFFIQQSVQFFKNLYFLKRLES